VFEGIAGMIAKSAHTVDVQRAQTMGADNMGSTRTTWITNLSAVPCWVQPASSNTIDHYGRKQIIVTHSVYFATDPAVATGYRLVFKGRNLLVQGKANVGEMNKLWRLDCDEH
jgi:hypothetical protein